MYEYSVPGFLNWSFPVFLQYLVIVSIFLVSGLVSCFSRVTTLFLQGEEEEKGGNSGYLKDTVDACSISTSNCSKRVVLIHYTLQDYSTVIAVNSYVS
jgi:hypothetical protein